MFEMQKVLDEKIYERFPGLKDEPWDWKILALLTELGECANEWRGFKKWSEDQRPRVEEWIECSVCRGTGDLNYEAVQEDAEGSGGHEYIDCEECDCAGTVGVKNPLLEEYVDCLHFILSIGLELNMQCEELAIDSDYTRSTTTKTFNELFRVVGAIETTAQVGARGDLVDLYEILLNLFVGMGEKFLGFTVDEVESAYFAKNEVNHVRQAEGY